ncbi:unnamed protein product [Schistocephalus solidus]|uniref:F-box domain-containing protein n=1 Tax=Schistocephalus solidus TaxID=70667 RepID=A0A183SNM6_SCHSO|nr:unnamed protein product [Schistocephalus solidus]
MTFLRKTVFLFRFVFQILWNPIISARISRYLSRQDRLNCKSLIPTWDRLTTRILALSPNSWCRQPELIAILQDASQGAEIFPLEFASDRGKNVIQILLLLSGPSGTGLVNVTSLDIMQQPISIEQMSEILVNCPMPRLRDLSLSVVVRNARPRVSECLKSKLHLEEVAIRFFGGLLPSEILLLLQSFGDVRSMSLDDSSHRRYRIPSLRRRNELRLAWIPPWTFLQIHHESELLDLFLDEKEPIKQLPELTLLTEPSHFFPKRYITKSTILPRILKYRTLKKPPLDIPQFCRACASTADRRRMPRSQCTSTDMIQDGEATVNFVACSLMSVDENSVLHPLDVHDLYVHISPTGGRSTATLPNASSTAATITKRRKQAPVRSAVEFLIQRHCSEIKKLSIRLCKPGDDEIKRKYIQELPSLARDFILPIIEMCGSNISLLEVSAEIIWACCNDVLTKSRLLRLQEKCLNVRNLVVITIDGPVVEQQLRPSAKNVSTYLSLFPALKEVQIISGEIFRDRTIHELLSSCKHLRRLYVFSKETPNIDYAPLPRHNALDLLFLELNGVSGDDCGERILKETLSNFYSPRYILLKIDHAKYPSGKTLKAFFADRTELRWLVIVYNK